MSDNSNEKKDEKKEPEKPVEENDGKSYEYELIGVTVHTGTADGGHYYAFIRDRYGIYIMKLYIYIFRCCFYNIISKAISSDYSFLFINFCLQLCFSEKRKKTHETFHILKMKTPFE